MLILINIRKILKHKKKDDFDNKFQKVIENIDHIEEKRNLRNSEILKKYNKIQKQNYNRKHQYEDNLRQKSASMRKRVEKVFERKYSNDVENSIHNEKSLNRQYFKNLVADEIESSLSGKVHALHEEKILNQIINQRKISGYVKKINELQSDNVFLKSPNRQKKIFFELKQKELAEQQKKRG